MQRDTEQQSAVLHAVDREPLPLVALPRQATLQVRDVIGVPVHVGRQNQVDDGLAHLSILLLRQGGEDVVSFFLRAAMGQDAVIIRYQCSAASYSEHPESLSAMVVLKHVFVVVAERQRRLRLDQERVGESWVRDIVYCGGHQRCQRVGRRQNRPQRFALQKERYQHHKQQQCAMTTGGAYPCCAARRWRECCCGSCRQRQVLWTKHARVRHVPIVKVEQFDGMDEVHERRKRDGEVLGEREVVGDEMSEERRETLSSTQLAEAEHVEVPVQTAVFEQGECHRRHERNDAALLQLLVRERVGPVVSAPTCASSAGGGRRDAGQRRRHAVFRVAGASAGLGRRAVAVAVVHRRLMGFRQHAADRERPQCVLGLAVRLLATLLARMLCARRRSGAHTHTG